MDISIIKFGEKEKIVIPPKIEGFLYEDSGIKPDKTFDLPVLHKIDPEARELKRKAKAVAKHVLEEQKEDDIKQRFSIIEKKDRSVQSSLLQNLDKFLSECWARYFEYISWRQSNYISHNIVDNENMKNYLNIQIGREARTIRTILDGLVELVGMRRSVFELRDKTYEQYVDEIENFDGDMRLDAHASPLTLAGSIIAGKKEHKTARVGMPRSQAGYAGTMMPQQKPTVEQIVW